MDIDDNLADDGVADDEVADDEAVDGFDEANDARDVGTEHLLELP